MKQSKFVRYARWTSLLLSAIMALSLLAGCASTSSGGDVKLKSDKSVVTGTMANGMSYYVQKNPEPKNRISLRLVVKAGSNMEDDDQKGFAHLIEHMAFNGTEHFEKNGIIKFFEENGMNFGADLNAYTSFDETVYMLEIPADNPEVLDQALLILRDWAAGITFPADELEKERGVVREEWRMRSLGLSARINDLLVQQTLKGSRYADRLPIGDMDIIMKQKRQRLVDFYEKWYRPELMSVVVVGDADTATLVNVIKKNMATIPASEKPITKPVYTVPENNTKTVSTLRDPEQAYPLTQIMAVNEDYQAPHTESQYRRSIVENVAFTIANQRIMELSVKPDCPWIGANYLASSITNHSLMMGLAFVPKDGQYQNAFKLMLDEYDRLLLHGITQAELDNTKLAMSSNIEATYKEAANTTSSVRAQKIVAEIVAGQTNISDADAYRLSKAFLPKITVEEVNSVIREMFPDRGTICLNLAPTGDKTLPSDAVIKDLWTNYRSSELAAYEDKETFDEIMKAPSKKATVVSKKTIKELGATEYVFDNGATVYTKKTNYEKNSIYMSAYSKGGSYLYDSKDYPSLKTALQVRILSGIGDMDFSQFRKFISGKNVSFNLNVSNTFESMYAYSGKEDAEIMFQLLYQIFENPKFTDAGWSLTMDDIKASAKSYNLEPMSAFSNKVNELLFNDPYRFQDINDSYVKLVDRKKGEKLFTERFSNAADWAFIIVGDFDEKAILDYCSSYIGNLKGDSSKKETAKEPMFKIGSGIKNADVVKGKEAQGAAFIGFVGSQTYPEDMTERWKQEALFEQLSCLLDIRLREVIREDKSGAYNVNVGGNIDGKNNRYYMVPVVFSCDPTRSKELIQAAVECIKDLQANLVDDSYLKTLKETYRRNKETNLRSNSWWANRILYGAYLQEEPLSVAGDTTSVPSWITAEAIRDAARKYLPTDNYVSATLRPEK
ncbi:MAG: insulinase family protein [Treponema sp.]|nr:insulinase family protein [Treponema sp.]